MKLSSLKGITLYVYRNGTCTKLPLAIPMKGHDIQVGTRKWLRETRQLFAADRIELRRFGRILCADGSELSQPAPTPTVLKRRMATHTEAVIEHA